MKLSLALAPLLLGMQVARGTDFPPERYPYPFPVERFTPWAYRKSGPVSRLGYTETTWNIATLYTGANPIEEQTYADLTDAQKAALTELGISQESWDCWIHHYDGYYWRDLPRRARSGFSVLGYNQSLWDDGGLNPPVTGAWWDNLSSLEMAAAVSICYTKQSWDEDPLSDREVYFGADQLVIPSIRLTEWDDLTAALQAVAESLDYNETTWNLIGEAWIEDDIWFDRNSTDQAAILALGFDPWTWSCTMNHFEDYNWVDLEAVEIQLASTMMAFGFNSTSWDEDLPNEVWEGYWEDLTPEQQIAADKICYNQLLWDGDLSLLPPTTSPSSSPSLSPTTVATTATPTMLPTPMPTRPPTSTPSPNPVPTAPIIEDVVSESDSPSDVPSDMPSDMPSDAPSDAPSDSPSLVPTELLANVPTVFPSFAPSEEASSFPSSSPTIKADGKGEGKGDRLKLRRKRRR